MTDAQLRGELQFHAASRWRRQRLLEHAKKHARDWEWALGHALGSAALEDLSTNVLWSWDRLFTGLDAGGVTFVFAKRQADGFILVVATREGRIRTAFPAPRLDEWMRRNEHYIEITDRARVSSEGH